MIQKDKEFESEVNEEIKDIIENIPLYSGKIVTYLIIIITIFLICSTWMIQYPETIEGKIEISSTMPPIHLYSRSSGNLKLLGRKSGDFVKKGEVFAYIESSVDFDDVMLLDSLLDFDNIKLDINYLNKFPKIVNIGDMTDSYYKYVDYLSKIIYRNIEKQYESKIINNKILINEEHKRREKLCLIKGIKEITSKYTDNLFCIDSVQYHNLKSISKSDFDRKRIEYLNSKEENISLKSEIDLSIHKVDELKNISTQLDLEKSIYQLDIINNYYATRSYLKDQIRKWLINFAFYSPVNGKLEYMDFLEQHKYIEAGHELFSIVSEKNIAYGCLYISSIGAGKVKKGQDVLIKIDDYPYLEFGIYKGKVNAISNIPIKELNGKNDNSTMYLVRVDLSKDLSSNFGRNLRRKIEITGRANIVTSKRRLLERLFDNLKYIAN